MPAIAGWFGEVAEGLPPQVRQTVAVALLFALAGLGICAIILAVATRTRGEANAPVRRHGRTERANVKAWAHTGDRNHNIDRRGADR